MKNSSANIVFATYCTHAAGKFEDLIHNRFRIPVTVLGWGENWIGYVSSKIRVVGEFANTLPNDTLLCVVDGFDTVFANDISKMEDAFLLFDSPIVISLDLAPLGAFSQR